MANTCLKCSSNISESRLYCDECLIKFNPKYKIVEKSSVV